MDNFLKIHKNPNLKGEYGYKIFSIRIKDSTVEKLDEISSLTNRSRNEIISIMLEFGIENCRLEE